MRTVLALVTAAGLSLGLATTSRAQVVVGANPVGGGGAMVGNPYGTYSRGYYGPGVGYFAPGAAVYSSGYSGYAGVAPASVGSPYVYPATVRYGYFPAYGAASYVYPGYGYRRAGLFNRWRGMGMWW